MGCTFGFYTDGFEVHKCIPQNSNFRRQKNEKTLINFYW